jgi:hypothetical protein
VPIFEFEAFLRGAVEKRGIPSICDAAAWSIYTKKRNFWTQLRVVETVNRCLPTPVSPGKAADQLYFEYLAQISRVGPEGSYKHLENQQKTPRNSIRGDGSY